MSSQKLKPFFTFYGAKWRLAPRYPAPTTDRLVEPLAGSAGYSLRHPEREVILVERDPALAAELRAMDRTPAPTEEPDPRPGMDYTPRSSGPYGVRDLLFAAGARCGCGEPLAYPLDHAAAFRDGVWTCFAVLRGAVDADPVNHPRLPFMLYDVRAETSTREGGRTTRPEGSRLMAVNTYACKCGRTWEDPPRPAGTFAPWAGDCPGCGTAAKLANGASNSDVRGGARLFVVMDPPQGSPE